MPKEIERKFLVANESWRESVVKQFPLQQGYLNTDPERTVRIRIRGKRGILTIKGKGKGIVRPEFEYEIPLDHAQQLLLLSETNIISKVRHHVIHAGNTWEIDVFEGVHEGLVLAEIELKDANQTITLPDWAGQEVSEDGRYFNSALSKK